MYKIKPTTLDSYRIYKNEIFEKSLEDIIDTIKGQTQTTEAMTLGSEIHKYFETGSADLMCEELESLKVISSQLPTGVNEIKFSEEVGDYLFSVVIDRMNGLESHDFKSTSRFYGVDFYESSLQWKIYLLASGCRKFTYHIITHNTTRPYNFKYLEPFSFYPYQGMIKEIMDYCNEFVDFCKLHNLEKYIEVDNG